MRPNDIMADPDDEFTAPRDGGPAFPDPALADTNFCPDHSRSGLSMRDWFAGQALASPVLWQQAATLRDYEIVALVGPKNSVRREEILAALAYQIADAMLAARSKPRA